MKLTAEVTLTNREIVVLGAVLLLQCAPILKAERRQQNNPSLPCPDFVEASKATDPKKAQCIIPGQDSQWVRPEVLNAEQSDTKQCIIPKKDSKLLRPRLLPEQVARLRAVTIDPIA